ncbi:MULTISPECIES: CRISPR-associated endonuclease Cas2 [Erysipelotrichaceae]|uniref:CRISPR-associated endoribonuclease Cas2 n=2 Tax=Erysipelotrichales TaxID=526525 RepID=A0A1Q9YNP5_9FIRM|nr:MULTISPECIES: CRISPR-associated endonuclease Cas2 [Erysipelotrichaceae]OLU47462.1 CRISPR-associated endonuclease Cas2 [Faecalibaculum rodentium]
MRVILMFDLPVLTSRNRRDYSMFRKFLIKSGFMMMQESVYCKLTTNQSSAETVLKMVRANKPPEGLIQTLIITEKQFSKMDFILGQPNSDVVATDESVLDL